MVRRIFAVVLIVLGLGTIGAAIASGTIWRPDDRVTLTLPATPDVPVVITAPGVLNAVDNDVDVRVVGAAADSPIVLAMARESDVLAWVADAPYWEITGLADWETLAYTDSRDAATADPSETATEATDAATDATDAPTDATEAAEEPAPVETVPNPTGSDLWVEELTGTGELAYSWTAIPGRWVMLVATDGTQPAPQVELTWDREVETPFVQPGIILGSVVLLLGLGLLVMQLLADAEKRRARRAAVTPTAAGAVDDAVPAVVATDGERPLTRREIRLADEARRRGARPESAAAADQDAGAVGDQTETIPAVPAEAEPAEDRAPGAHAAPAAAPEAAVDEPADDAGELDAWVRSGSASPLMHEGDRTTPADLEVGAGERTDEHAAVQPPEATPSDEEPPARESWWRRRSARRSEEPVVAAESASTQESEQAANEQAAEADRPEPVTQTGQAGQADHAAEVVGNGADEPAAGDDVPAAGETDEIPAVRPDDEGDPQEWGASWRQTWGLGSAEPDQTDPDDEPKEGDR
ncbi:hypothetical protein [Pseudactinotalea suaedae]|uniref:hypothetical protein n=1 Tax=Pseudactinotalea suaedae TaxID=1524924 RepID=UPI0012E159BD|nr:hypothetical protein [Pseudactinotalea suaedae]